MLNVVSCCSSHFHLLHQFCCLGLECWLLWPYFSCNCWAWSLVSWSCCLFFQGVMQGMFLSRPGSLELFLDVAGVSSGLYLSCGWRKASSSVPFLIVAHLECLEEKWWVHSPFFVGSLLNLVIPLSLLFLSILLFFPTDESAFLFFLLNKEKEFVGKGWLVFTWKIPVASPTSHRSQNHQHNWLFCSGNRLRPQVQITRRNQNNTT